MRLLLLGLMLCFATSVVAQETLKIEAKVTPMTSGGEPVGCSLEYTLIIRDRVYRNGGLVGLTGTYAWLADADRVSFLGLFKLGALDFDAGMKGTVFRPATTVLRIGGRVHRPQKSIPCDLPTNVCGAYSMDASTDVFKDIIENDIEIGYNRKSGAFDVMIPIAIEDAVRSKLLGCMKNFTSSLRQ